MIELRMCDNDDYTGLSGGSNTNTWVLNKREVGKSESDERCNAGSITGGEKTLALKREEGPQAKEWVVSTSWKRQENEFPS